MDIEQLKLILDMLGAAGEGSVTLFVLYLGYSLIQTAAWASVPIVLFVLGYRAIKNAWDKPNPKIEHEFMVELARTYDGSRTLYGRDKIAIIEIVHQWREAKDA